MNVQAYALGATPNGRVSVAERKGKRKKKNFFWSKKMVISGPPSFP